MPLLPVCLIEPLWVEFSARLGVDERPEFSVEHPWGCHRRRVPDRIVFEHILALPEMKCRRGCEDPRLTLVSLP